MGTVWIIIVLLNAMATVALWRGAVRRTARPAKKFVKALLHSKPIVARHGRPERWTHSDDSEVVNRDRGRRATQMLQNDQAFFNDFSEFGEVVNRWFETTGDCWRLQELSDNELRLFSRDYPPRYGRRYSIFYNQAELGVLEMRHYCLVEDYSDENPVVLTAIKLRCVRLIELGALRSFLDRIATHVSEYDRGGTERTEVRAAIDHAIQQVLWNTQHVSAFPPELNETDWGELECRFQGSAFSYLKRREQLHGRLNETPGRRR